MTVEKVAQTPRKWPAEGAERCRMAYELRAQGVCWTLIHGSIGARGGCAASRMRRGYHLAWVYAQACGLPFPSEWAIPHVDPRTGQDF
jgi:hypothetical protein